MTRVKDSSFFGEEDLARSVERRPSLERSARERVRVPLVDLFFSDYLDSLITLHLRRSWSIICSLIS